MNGLLWVDGPAAPWSFVFVTLGLGGLAAFAAGRALARTWRPFGHVFIHVALLSFAVGFLHYALFGEPAIPITRIGGALARIPQAPLEALTELAALVRGYGVIALVLAAIAGWGFSRTRRRQMELQYGFDRI